MNKNLLRGSLETIVIKLLSDHGELYGYDICQRVKAITKDEVVLTEGALYPTLHRLEGKGSLTSETRKAGNRYRKYYSLTTKGNEELSSILRDMEDYIRNMQVILNHKLSQG